MRNELGRLPRTFDQRIPHLSSVRLMGGIQLPALPNEIDNAIGLPADLGVMRNADLGDCTSAGAYHAVQVWTKDAAGAMLTEPDAMVVQFYSEATGYNPADPSTDQGGNEQAVLSRWLNTGLPMADGSRSKLSAFVEVDPRNLRDVCEAIYECGLVYIGLSVPELLPEDGGAVWATTTDLGPIVGGHCVILTGYSAPSNPVFDVISWGQRFQMTASFWSRYVDECYALASPLWINAAGRTPWGLDPATLAGIMQAIREPTP